MRFYCEEAEAVLRDADSTSEGLTGAEAEKRLAANGKNKLAEGKKGGTAFMEDYTYHLAKGKEYSLGAHMLEVCPTVAAGKPKIEVHPLGIGGESPLTIRTRVVGIRHA